MKYRCLKDFLDEDAVLHLVGNEFELEASHFVKMLLANGFIEEIKYESWRPKYNDEYWFVSSDGAESISVWESHLIDEYRYNFGNCFQTKEQAVEVVEWLKAFKVLRDDTKGFKPNWSDDDERKFSVGYNHDMGELEIYTGRFAQNTIIYFATEADAEESIKKHSHEWKIFFGIEEG